MAKNGHDDTIGGWEELIDAVKSHGEDLPGAGSLLTALELHLREAIEAKDRQQLHRAGGRRATRDLGKSMADGRETFSRLRSLVKSAYGPRDERLRKFGMTPIEQGSRKSRKSKQQEGQTAPPVTTDGGCP